MGVVSCLGNTLDEVSKSLFDCKSGIKFSETYKEKGMKSHICGRPDIDCDALIDRKQTRFMGDNCKYAYIAMERAIEDSGLTPEQIASPRVGGILGQGGTSVPDIAETIDAVNAGKNRRIGPYRVTRSMGSTVSAVLSTAFKLQGVSYSISSACSTGAHCIGVGMEQIQLGKQDICFCGAGEAEGWGFSVMFDSMGALSTNFNDNPPKASRAFDQSRDGFVIGAGGGVVVVEELEHAKARGAKIYARARRLRRQRRRLRHGRPERARAASAAWGWRSAMATEIGGAEGARLRQHARHLDAGRRHDGAGRHEDGLHRGRATSPYVGSTKSLSGHALGAAGVHEAIYSLLMLRRRLPRRERPTSTTSSTRPRA